MRSAGLTRLGKASKLEKLAGENSPVPARYRPFRGLGGALELRAQLALAEDRPADALAFYAEAWRSPCFIGKTQCGAAGVRRR